MQRCLKENNNYNQSNVKNHYKLEPYQVGVSYQSSFGFKKVVLSWFQSISIFFSKMQVRYKKIVWNNRGIPAMFIVNKPLKKAAMKLTLIKFRLPWNNLAWKWPCLKYRKNYLWGWLDSVWWGEGLVCNMVTT